MMIKSRASFSGFLLLVLLLLAPRRSLYNVSLGIDVVPSGSHTYHPASTRMVPRLRICTFVP